METIETAKTTENMYRVHRNHGNRKQKINENYTKHENCIQIMETMKTEQSQ